MGKSRASQRMGWPRAAAASIIQLMLLLNALIPNSVPFASAQPVSPVGIIKPTTYPLLFGSSGNVEIDIPKPGIAVRIEIPRDFLRIGEGTTPENDTSFVTSNIRNDYFYYNLVDESKHWTYDWHDNASDGPCFKPNFSYYDPNAPYCLEIWNYLSSPLNYSTSHLGSNNPPAPFFKQPDHTIYCYTPGPTSYYDQAPTCNSLTPGHDYFDHTLFPLHTFDYTYLVGVDYCQQQLNLERYVFQCFNATAAAPKFVLLHDLSSPTLAGTYNFTLFVANRTNILGYPDFVHAWNTTLYVAVSMTYNAGSIVGYVCDAGSGSPGCSNRIRGKGVVFALRCPSTGACSVGNATIVARAYVNQASCQAPFTNCGLFDLTGLARGNYIVEGSAGVDRGIAYSLTVFPNIVSVSPNQATTGIDLALRRSPQVCVTISYENSNLNPISSLSGQSDLLAAGFRANPDYNLNVTVEGTDTLGDIFRLRGVSTDSTSDNFALITGVGVEYVGTNPYGTEFAGLPAPEDYGTGGYTLTVNVWVSGYIQLGGFSVVQLLHSPGTTTPACAPTPNQPTALVTMRTGGLIIGTLIFQSQPGTLESPFNATASLQIKGTFNPKTHLQALFAGNVVIEAYDQTGILRGITVINGTLYDGAVGYASCGSYDDICAMIPFYVFGFADYYNHSLSGVWRQRDYGLPDGTYSLSVYVRGYELTSVSPASIAITNGGNATAAAYMSQGGAFEITTSSWDTILGTRNLTQACLPWRFLDSSIPVRARVYFFGSTGSVGYVEVLMATRGNGQPIQNSTLSGVLNFTICTFKVVFAGQNWNLQKIWFYGDLPTFVGNDNYTVESETLGYVAQFPPGITSTNSLLGFSQNSVTLLYGNEIDETVPIYSNPQTLSKTPEYDHAIGQAFSGPLLGAEMTNLTAGQSNLDFNVYGFGGMQLNITINFNGTQIPLCVTDVFLSGVQNICGQGHFLYVDPSGTSYVDYGLDLGNYTAEVPEFGFTARFLQVFPPPYVSFTDLLLRTGVVFPMVQMGSILLQGSGTCTSESSICGYTSPPGLLAPLSWAQVQATNANYTGTVSTADGSYYGVEALFLPAGTYNVTFSDVGYEPQTLPQPIFVGWASSTPESSPPLCPIGVPTC